MRLLLARHGQTAWNLAGKAQGHADIPLDEIGRAQAAALARGLAEAGVERVLASDLVRAQETAGALGLPVEARAALRERAFGEWEGRHYLDVIADLDAIPGDRLLARPPGSESLFDLWERAGPIAEELRTFDRTTLVVAHGAFLAALLARLLDGTPGTMRAFRFPNGAVTEFGRRGDGSLMMVRYAEPFA